MSQNKSNNQINISPTTPSIGLITALPKEYAAIKVLLENTYEYNLMEGKGAGRSYLYGEIPSLNYGKHSVVLALLPSMANNFASIRATMLLNHFPNVSHVIMVGIAGGVPHPKKPNDHVRLGVRRSETSHALATDKK